MIKKDITVVDKNFDTGFLMPEDVQWFDVNQEPFSIHGVTYSNEEGLYRRLSKDVADATNQGVSELSLQSAGGRIRFMTDSPYIILRIEEPFWPPFSHMPMLTQYGTSIFVNGAFEGAVMPSYYQVVDADPSRGGDGKIVFGGIKYPYGLSGELYQVEIFLPLYGSVSSVFVGLKDNSQVKAPKPYKHEQPVLFYGSSITQGGCASKPGDDYISRLSRMLDTDFINLGFSGSARAEDVIVDYIASQNPSVFVMDYDHNAPDAEHLKKTHYTLYEKIRKEHSTTPIIMMTMPTIEGYESRPLQKCRKDEILKSYNRAIENGDENVYLVDCYGCFGAYKTGECGTVDGSHPDSLGFLRMAERMYPVLDKILNHHK